MIFQPPEGLTFEAVYIALIILACAVGLETAIIGSLLVYFGSPKELWRAIIKPSTQRHKKTTNK